VKLSILDQSADEQLLLIYQAFYLYVYVICNLKSCVNCIELANGARLSTRGEIPATFRSKNKLVMSVEWKYGTRIGGYL
jgi:hypothetical protein